MKITILSVGNIKEKYLKDAILEYSKRISKYATLEFIKVNDEATIDNASIKEIEIIKDKEGKRLLKYLQDDSYKIALAIDGVSLSSVELAKKMEEIFTYSSSKITFIIGGSLGLSNEVLNLADYKLSFSKLTFPHQLMQVILLEQIYRTFKINNNESYHK